MIRVPIITKDAECKYSEVYGYIYITINKTNGKKYIGLHRSKGMNKDSYIGSGRLISNAINKYGKACFENWIIDWAKTKEELNNKEKYWIREFKAVESKDYYNLFSGGEGASSQDMLGNKNHRWGTKEPIELTRYRVQKMTSNPNWKENHKKQLKTLKQKNLESGQIKRMHEGNKLNYYQYTIQGEFIRCYHSKSELYKNGFTYYVSDCCKGKQPFSSGFIWSYNSPEEFSMQRYLDNLSEKAKHRYNLLMKNPDYFERYKNKYANTDKFTPKKFN